MKIKVLRACGGSGGQSLEKGEIYDVSAKDATILIEGGSAELAERGLVKVRVLRDDFARGLNYGEIVELHANSVEELIKKVRVELFETESKRKKTVPTVKLLSLANTQARAGDDTMQSLTAGQTYDVKAKDDAVTLIQYGSAMFADSVELVKVVFTSDTIFKGATLRQGFIVEISPEEAMELAKKGRINIVGYVEKKVEEESKPPQETEKKGFFGLYKKSK